MKEEKLTYQDIREASSNYLRSLLKEDQQLYEVIMKLKSKLEEVQTTMEEESEDYNPEFDAASYT